MQAAAFRSHFENNYFRSTAFQSVPCLVFQANPLLATRFLPGKELFISLSPCPGRCQDKDYTIEFYDCRNSRLFILDMSFLPHSV